MNKKIIIFIIIAVIFGGFLWYNYSQLADNKGTASDNSKAPIVEEGPFIEVSPVFYDFGAMAYGEIAEYNFTITNKGSEPLEILRLSTSCGCTTAEINEEDEIIEGGESVNMTVKFDPAVHEDDSDVGVIKRVVYIKTNDPRKPEAEVEINAFVVKREQLKIFEVSAKQWEFIPSPIKVKEGDLVRLKITTADVAHSLALPEFGIMEMIEPGKEAVVEFLADKRGTFDFYCSVPCGPGHGDMRGQLIIE